MARARGIKPGFFTNDLMAEIEPLGRLLFAGLWTIADRDGRLMDRPRKIRAEVLPYDDCDADALLSQLATRGFIQRYESHGIALIQVVNWKKHQQPHINERPSELPAPDEHDAPTVAVTDEHPSSTVLAPDEHRTNPSDSFNLTVDSGVLTPDPGQREPARTAAAAAPPERANGVPKKHPRDLGPLVDAFKAAGLSPPKFSGAEARAANELLAHWTPADLATCWQDHVSGDYGDEFSRRDLSFAYLNGRNRVGNWSTWRAAITQPPDPIIARANGVTFLPMAPGVYPNGVRCECGHGYSVMGQACPKCETPKAELPTMAAVS